MCRGWCKSRVSVGGYSLHSLKPITPMKCDHNDRNICVCAHMCITVHMCMVT